MLKWLWLSGLVLVLDQASKWMMTSWLSLYETVAVMPFFNLTMAHNTGAAFSFLAQAGGWQRWFFAAVAAIVSVVLLVWLKRLSTTAKLEAASISLILGGAIGNLVDRISLGYVVDFLDFYNYYGSYHFPAFNIADSAICIGAVLLIIDSFSHKQEQA
ncbi:MAG: signal peptidase II [Proteobacteria bacterium]|nr:signal peptidase II [Pseudomonadota bacterium]